MSFRLILCLLVFSPGLYSCSEEDKVTAREETVSAKHELISYQEQIQPIFDSKCVACHACYDAPCQLILTSGDGLQRGANKKSVYNSLRVEPVPPTRLHIDQTSIEGWRDAGFFSITSGSREKKSLLLSMLELGREAEVFRNQKLDKSFTTGIKRKNICPVENEFDLFRQNHATAGMPYGVTGLTTDEYQLLKQWLGQGAVVDKANRKLSKAELQEIKIWEDFFNGTSQQQQLVARYLYEHLFIAHLYFDHLNKRQFYQLVRSSTPPGNEIKPLAKVRPNDAPESEFWYRLMPINDTIVYKTHITYDLNPEKLSRYKELFSGDWPVDSLPDYDEQARSNPFITFAAIPAKARYQFMLDDAEYFVRTFIRGPVCHGQIATDVINDHFWNLFQSPDSDIYINNPAYRDKVTPLLALPGIEHEVTEFLPEWFEFRKLNINYLEERQQAYAQFKPEGANLTDIWNGDDGKPDALQTILRHHNSAAITTGLIGDIPKTIWVMDYALFERSFYVLVVNFNVFGNIAHQTLTRLYFDLIRNGAEQNFLRFMPADIRKDMIENWYRDTGKIKLYLSYDEVDSKAPVSINYNSDKPKHEFVELLLKQLKQKSFSLQEQVGNDQLLSLLKNNLLTLPVIEFMPEISMLRIFNQENTRTFYSLVRDREHTNVAFLLGEKLRYEPEQDHLTIYPGILGSYPNFMFNVPEEQVHDFVRVMFSIQNETDFKELIDRWGIRRTHPDFWKLFHDMEAYLLETMPEEAGILDMNRYLNL